MAKSWHDDNTLDHTERHAPEKAYDGDYRTTYNVKDGDAEGNFLKLYLSQPYLIGTVNLTNVMRGCCDQRIFGTMVTLYSIAGGVETEVTNCGEEITGRYSYLLQADLHVFSKTLHFRFQSLSNSV